MFDGASARKPGNMRPVEQKHDARCCKEVKSTSSAKKVHHDLGNKKQRTRKSLQLGFTWLHVSHRYPVLYLSLFIHPLPSPNPTLCKRTLAMEETRAKVIVVGDSAVGKVLSVPVVLSH